MNRNTASYNLSRRTEVGIRVAVALFCTAAMSTSAHATENGNEEFPIGVNTVLPGVEPPAGATEYYNYSNFYDVGSSIGANGRKNAPAFHVNVLANAFRVLHSWNYKVDGFWFTSGLVAPLVNINLSVAGQHSSATDIADLDFQVLYLNWENSSHTVFAFGGLDVYAPTSNYSKNDLVSVGLNYWTFMPNGAVTWFLSKRVQASLDTSWQIPTENHATHYQSGNSVDFDYAVDVSPIPSRPKLFFGLQGYAFQQFTPDKLDGATYENGNEGRVLAIGPQVRYDLFHGGIAVKYQHEFAVQNHTKGDKVWLQFALPI